MTFRLYSSESQCLEALFRLESGSEIQGLRFPLPFPPKGFQAHLNHTHRAAKAGFTGTTDSEGFFVLFCFV